MSSTVSTQIDVREIAPLHRHALIFEGFDARTEPYQSELDQATGASVRLMEHDSWQFIKTKSPRQMTELRHVWSRLRPQSLLDSTAASDASSST